MGRGELAGLDRASRGSKRAGADLQASARSPFGLVDGHGAQLHLRIPPHLNSHAQTENHQEQQSRSRAETQSRWCSRDSEATHAWLASRTGGLGPRANRAYQARSGHHPPPKLPNNRPARRGSVSRTASTTTSPQPLLTQPATTPTTRPHAIHRPPPTPPGVPIAHPCLGTPPAHGRRA